MRVLQRALQRRQVVVRHKLKACGVSKKRRMREAAARIGRRERSLRMRTTRPQRTRNAPGTKGPKRSYEEASVEAEIAPMVRPQKLPAQKTTFALLAGMPFTS